MEYKFSVLLSLYSKEKPEYLIEALESVYNQILLPDEVVLVEDGPLTDDLYKVLEKYKKEKSNFRTIKLEKNSGLGEALKIGLQECKYNLIARMDTDDICKKERFEEQIECYKKDNSLDIVGSWIDEFSRENNEIIVKQVRRVEENDKEIKKALKIKSEFNHPTVMIKKSSVLEVGNYRGKYYLMEDYDLWIRMALKNMKFYNIQRSLLYFRISEDVYKRRGGIKFIKSDIVFQNNLLEQKYITNSEWLRNNFIRILFRIIPWRIRGIAQKKILRKI